MPTYDYRCPVCGVEQEVFRWVREPHPVCCEQPMTQLFRDMTFIGVEFKSGVGFDPTTKHDTPYHGDHFDLGAGRWFRDKNERKAWMRSKNVKEVGTDWDKSLNLKHVTDERRLQQG